MVGEPAGYELEVALELTVYTVPLLVVAVVGTVLSLWLTRYWRRAGVYPVIGVFGGSALWAGAYAFELSSRTAGAALLWQNLRITATTVVPVAILFLAVQVTGRDGPVAYGLASLLTVPPVVTNYLLWRGADVWVRSVAFDPATLPPLSPEWGWWYFVYVGYQVLLTILAIALFAEFAVEQGPDAGLRPTHLLLFATVLPTLGTVFYVADYTPVDYGAYAFLVSGLLMLVALFYLPDRTGGTDGATG